jgi:hypothetical protein
MRVLEDIELIEGRAKVIGGEDPLHHSVEEYRKLLLGSIPKVPLPHESLDVVLDAAIALSDAEIAHEDLVDTLRLNSGERLDASAASRGIAVMWAVGLLEASAPEAAQPDRVYRRTFGDLSSHDLRLRIERFVEDEISGRLGRVEPEVLAALCGSEAATVELRATGEDSGPPAQTDAAKIGHSS